MEKPLRNNQLKYKLGALQKALTLAAVFSLAIAWQTQITKADITNIAQAFGSYASLNYGSNSSSQAVTVAPANPSLLVTKTPSPTTGVSAGQTVTYTYTVKNTGNLTITNVSLLDSHNAAGPAPVPSSEVISDDAGTPVVGDGVLVTSKDGLAGATGTACDEVLEP